MQNTTYTPLSEACSRVAIAHKAKGKQLVAVLLVLPVLVRLRGAAPCPATCRVQQCPPTLPAQTPAGMQGRTRLMLLSLSVSVLDTVTTSRPNPLLPSPLPLPLPLLLNPDPMTP